MAEKESWSGMTDQEAQEFHSFYIQGTVAFVATAIVAHFLVWMWRPWFPGPKGYGATLIDGATNVASAFVSLVS
jgi:light-harvesting complex 1 beta chain